MCLILLAWRAHADYPLVVAANRDERHDRAADGARFWRDAPDILAGRDLDQLGTWMGVTRHGKFAAVTNYRERAQGAEGGESRGRLASEYLGNGASPREYVAQVEARGDAYRGFNFVAADRDELWWVSNRGESARRLEPGVYGVSNHLLDTPWPKVRRGKRLLEASLEDGPSLDALFDLLGDRSYAPDAELPDTGFGLERERQLSAALIVSPEYGTRCSTALIVSREGRVVFAERSFDPQGEEQATLRYEFAFSR